ncbi:MAG: hypothetical protein AAGA46_10555 [Cyanobacteria bacterium P01_F01_bin.13]
MKYPAFSPAYQPENSRCEFSGDSQQPFKFSQFFAKLGQVLLAWFAPDNEPTITQVIDRQGQVWWRVDDPRTHHSYWVESETAVMIWLENN